MTTHRALLITLALAFFAVPGHALATNCSDCDDGGGGGGSGGGTVSHPGPPDTTINGWSGAGIVVNDATPTFGFTADEPGILYCRVDNAPYGFCASPKTTSHLADGQHTFWAL